MISRNYIVISIEFHNVKWNALKLKTFSLINIILTYNDIKMKTNISVGTNYLDIIIYNFRDFLTSLSCISHVFLYFLLFFSTKVYLQFVLNSPTSCVFFGRISVRLSYYYYLLDICPVDFRDFFLAGLTGPLFSIRSI